MSNKRLYFIILPGSRNKLIFAIGLAIVILINGMAILAHINENPLEGKRIIIDPGHGGIDGGTNDGHSFYEKDINLQIGMLLQIELEAMKAQVSLTRSTDISLDTQNKLSSSRHRRDLLARISQFNSGKYDLFISIHVNHSSSSGPSGPIVFYSGRVSSSPVLAKYLQDQLNRHAKGILGIKSIHKPVKSNYLILREAAIPGVIVETGFISNSREKGLLKSKDYQLKLSKALCDGLMDFFRSRENASSIRQDENMELPEDQYE